MIGQPFSCEPRPPEKFYQNLLAAGAEPAYMKCAYDCYCNFTTGTSQKSAEVFDNFPAITGRNPLTLTDFARMHADVFKY